MDSKEKLFVGAIWVHKFDKCEIKITDIGGFKELQYVMYKRLGKNNCFAEKLNVFLQAFEPKEEQKMLNKNQIEELKEVVKPLIKWLNENGHPHMKVIVETNGCEVVEGLASHITYEFVRD